MSHKARRESDETPHSELPVWTRDAVLCHQTQADCSRCPIKTHYQIKRCRMPQTVKKLLESNIPIPQSYLKKPRRKKGEGFEYAKQGCLRINATTVFITD